MIGLGLSLCGACVMADVPEAARAYFPSSQVRVNKAASTTVLQVLGKEYAPSTPDEWVIDNMSGTYAATVLSRGARVSTPGWGQMSCFVDQKGNVSFINYSGIQLQLSSRLWMASGNRASLMYCSDGVSYSQGNYASFEILFETTNTGMIKATLNGRNMHLDVFGMETTRTLRDMRFDPQKVNNTQVVSLTAFGGVDAIFYGSSWRNAGSREKWLCLPMRSADGKAALFESTTKQTIEDETLSVA